MNKVNCRHCDSEEVVIKTDGKSYTTFKCIGCDKSFTLKND